MSPYIAPALGVALLLAAANYLFARRKRRALRGQLRGQWGRPKAADHDAAPVAAYHRARSQPAIDDRTWKDLDLDAVFAFIDRTESIVGRQVLYHRLRSAGHSPDSLAAFDEIVESLRNDEESRLDLQLALRLLDGNNVYWLWSLALEPIDRLPSWAVIYPLFAIGMALLIALTAALKGPFLLFAVLGLVAGGALRGWFGRRLVPLMEPFAGMVRLLAVAERLGRIDHLPAGLCARLTDRLPGLRALRRSAGWLARTGAASGDLVSLVIEYFNLLFCLDANAAMVGVRELRRHQEDIRRIFEAVGELDAALSIASVRDGLGPARLKPCPTDAADATSVKPCARDVAWSRPVFADDGQPIMLEDLRHPLVENAVPNSVTLAPPAGLLVTGANMTGKSTFLRTVGVNVVLAQSIYTVFAAAYRAPWLSITSCITPGDDLRAGKSYYQAEVETLVAMLAGTNSGGTHLCLFDELFRGTNTLDRIGAASAVLTYLIRAGTNVIAATHDLELAALVPEYVVVHFGDRLTAEGLQFDYRLRPGPTTTRNAIALLGVLGAPQAVVSDALASSDRLRAMKSG